MENRKIYVGGDIINEWGTFKRNKRDIIENFKNEGINYILFKNIDGCYNKALIYKNINNNKNYILVSYNTIVAEKNGNKFIIYGYYSDTTKRHINEFLRYFKMNQLSKREIIEIENKWQKIVDYMNV